MGLSHKKQLAFSAILVVFMLGLVEICATVATRIISKKGWMAYVPHFTPEMRHRYLDKRVPLLSWGPMTDADGKVTKLKPAFDTQNSDPTRSCVSAYGGSYTEGEAYNINYPYYLAEQTKCPVANFGVGGFGTDQALMLYRAQKHLDRSEVVLLAHASEGILPILNQYRNLLYPGTEVAFKPRYIIENDALRYVAAPMNTDQDFDLLERSPEAALPNEGFLFRPRPGFPNTVALTRWAFGDYHTRAKLKKVPRYAEFYDPNHPTGAVHLLAKIFATFHDEVKKEGKQPLLAVLPICEDFSYAKRSGNWVEQPLVDLLQKQGISVLQVGREMEKKLGTRQAEQIYVACNSHPNGAGYEMIAEALAERLSKDRLIAGQNVSKK